MYGLVFTKLFGMQMFNKMYKKTCQVVLSASFGSLIFRSLNQSFSKVLLKTMYTKFSNR